MTTVISPTSKPDFTGLNLSQLLEAWYSVKNELTEIDCDHYEHFCLDPIYEREYRHLRKPLEDKLDVLAKALEPYYLAECARERQERLMGRGAA